MARRQHPLAGDHDTRPVEGAVTTRRDDAHRGHHLRRAVDLRRRPLGGEGTTNRDPGPADWAAGQFNVGSAGGSAVTRSCHWTRLNTDTAMMSRPRSIRRRRARARAARALIRAKTNTVPLVPHHVVSVCIAGELAPRPEQSPADLVYLSRGPSGPGPARTTDRAPTGARLPRPHERTRSPVADPAPGPPPRGRRARRGAGRGARRLRGARWRPRRTRGRAADHGADCSDTANLGDGDNGTRRHHHADTDARPARCGADGTAVVDLQRGVASAAARLRHRLVAHVQSTRRPRVRSRSSVSRSSSGARRVRPPSRPSATRSANFPGGVALCRWWCGARRWCGCSTKGHHGAGNCIIHRTDLSTRCPKVRRRGWFNSTNEHSCSSRTPVRRRSTRSRDSSNCSRPHQ